MKKCSIITFIDKNPDKILSDISREDYIICADGGMKYALDFGIKPDIAIGDFDSYEGTVPGDIPVISLPTAKADTDTHYCVKYAIEKGYDDITIYGGLGGRFDHTLANMQTMAYAASAKCKIRLISENDEIHVITDSNIFIPYRDAYLSVLSLSEKSIGVSITGTEYDVKDIELSSIFPLGTSNKITEDQSEISVISGTLAIILSEENK